jgi:hypothetical protein
MLKWINGVFIVLVAAAGVGPEQAGSNIAEWLSFLGLHDVPAWLATKVADRSVLAVALLGLLVVNGVFLWRKFAPSKRTPVYKFQNLLDRAGVLLNEGQDSANLEVNKWISRVILWDQDVRLLLGSMPVELLMYKNISQEPQHGQDRLTVLTSLDRRRNKLRLIMGRYIS